MIRKILVATDFSENANRALNFAADMAEKLNASLTVVNVIQYVSGIITGGSEAGITFPEDYFVEMRKMSEQAMAKDVNKIKEIKPSLTITSIIKTGFPTNEIISIAENFDIIVIGHSGQNSLRDAFMGTTSERIVSMAKRPVLVVP